MRGSSQTERILYGDEPRGDAEAGKRAAAKEERRRKRELAKKKHDVEIQTQVEKLADEVCSFQRRKDIIEEQKDILEMDLSKLEVLAGAVQRSINKNHGFTRTSYVTEFDSFDSKTNEVSFKIFDTYERESAGWFKLTLQQLVEGPKKIVKKR